MKFLDLVEVANNLGLRLRAAAGAFYLTLRSGSTLTADRTLTVATGDADRTLTLSADATLSGTNTGDQDLSSYLTIASAASTYLTSATAASTYQPLDGDLTSLASATGTNTIYYRSAANTWSPVTVSTGLSFSGGTLSCTVSGTGTVTTVSVASANGFAGSVANATTTPAITISTTVTGLLKGNGTAVSAAVAGTDYASASHSHAWADVSKAGSSLADLATRSASDLSSGTLALARGGAGADLSATGGTANVVKQASAGAALTVGPLASTEVPLRHNLLCNGGAWFWTRQTTPGTLTTYGDDAYFADRWYVLTQTGSIQCNRTTGNAGPYALDLKQTQVSAQRMGCAQIVEYLDSYPMRGRTVRFQFSAKCSTTTTLRFAVLEWISTADSVTSDVVNSWTSTTYSASNFFVANVTVTGTTTASVGTSWTTCSVSGTVSANCNNLIVMVWTDGTAAQNVTVELAELTLCDANLSRDWLPDLISAEEVRCRRFCVGFNLHPLGLAAASNNLYGYGSIHFQPPMRGSPTLLSGASYSVNAGSAGTVQIQEVSAYGLSFGNSAANWTTNALVRLTAVLDAEL